MSNESKFFIKSGVLKAYYGTDRGVVIPEGVKEIGDHAFEDCDHLTEIVIPEGVTKIDRFAFSGCFKLSSITLPPTLKMIEEYAFQCCGMEEIDLPEGVNVVKSWAFALCDKMKRIIIPASLTEFHGNTITHDEGRGSLQRIEVSPDNGSLMSREGVLFSKDGTTLIRYPTGRKEAYTIPDGTTQIGFHAFEDCMKLTSVIIPEGVNEISDNAFFGCKKIKSITLPNSILVIGSDAFAFCEKLKEITIREGLKTIGKTAFCWCENLASITIPDSVTSIGEKVFTGCNSLTSIFTNTRLSKNVFDKGFSNPIITNDPGMFPVSMKPLTAIGFAEHPDDPRSERGKKHLKYIKSNAGKLIQEALTHPVLLRLMCENKLLTPEVAEAYLTAAQEAGDAESTALLMDYLQNRLTGKEKEKAAQKAETREEKVTDFIFSVETLEQLQGKVFVVTGKLNTFSSRDEFKACLDACGAILSETLNEQTNYLITNTPDSGSAKNKKAEALGVKKLSEAEFNRLIGRKQV